MEQHVDVLSPDALDATTAKLRKATKKALNEGMTAYYMLLVLIPFLAQHETFRSSICTPSRD